MAFKRDKKEEEEGKDVNLSQEELLNKYYNSGTTSYHKGVGSLSPRVLGLLLGGLF
jgi:hypothetical protein